MRRHVFAKAEQLSLHFASLSVWQILVMVTFIYSLNGCKTPESRYAAKQLPVELRAQEMASPMFSFCLPRLAAWPAGFGRKRRRSPGDGNDRLIGPSR